MRQNRQHLFNMSYLEVLGEQTGVGVDVVATSPVVLH